MAREIPPILQLVLKQIIQAQNSDRKTWNRLIQAYARLMKRLEPYVKAVEVVVKDNPDITRVKIQRTPEYIELMGALTSEVDDFSRFAKVEIEAATNESVMLALAHLRQTYKELGYTNVSIQPPDAGQFLADYLLANGPLMGRIKLWAGHSADQVKKMIIEGVGLGRNPRAISADIRKALGVGLSDALRTTRTAQLWSYREATRANYLANSDIVKGWIWFAALDERTCMSCMAMHGTVHPLTEALNDHHNGRCAMLPQIEGVDYGLDDAQAWFDAQTEDAKRAQMGAAKYDAYTAGQFQFSQLSKIREDEVYGTMRVETPLKELVNEQR